MNSKINIKGVASIKIQKKNGDVFEKTIDNIVVTTGKEFFAKKIFDNNLNQRIAKIGIGANGTEQVATDTFTSFDVSTNGADPIIKEIETQNSFLDSNTLNYVTNFFDTASDTLGNNQGIKELALIALDEGTPEEDILLCRTTFEDDGEFLKTASDIVTVTWRITIN